MPNLNQSLVWFCAEVRKCLIGNKNYNPGSITQDQTSNSDAVCALERDTETLFHHLNVFIIYHPVTKAEANERCFNKRLCVEGKHMLLKQGVSEAEF